MSVKKVLFMVSLLVLVTVMSAGEEYRWYKGQTHCHTLNSDGDQWPRKVVRWYRDHNYNFLVITDHDYITETKYLDTDKNDDFILITGEEVTDEYGDKPVHLNGIGIKRLVNPQRGESIIDTLQNNADAIVEAGGIAQVNHPHYQWAFGAKELTALNGVKLFEVYNLNHDCNNFAAGGEPGMETVWDRVLSAGKLMYGVIVDDTHDFEGEFRSEKAFPGKGWIMVRAGELTPKAIQTALMAGDFYGTVGILLQDIQITPKEYRITIVQGEKDMKYTTRFIGKNGKLLKEVFGLNAVYTFQGNEGYVRGKVVNSAGEFAITQPVFLPTK